MAQGKQERPKKQAAKSDSSNKKAAGKAKEAAPAKTRQSQAAKKDKPESATQTGAKATAKTSAKPEAKAPAKAKTGKSRKAAPVTTAVEPPAHVKPAAKKLLELHLQHELSQLQGDKVLDWLEGEVSRLMVHARKTQLNEVSSPELVMKVIHRNVINLKIAGGVTEIAGEMAARIYNSKEHRETLLKDIMTARQFEEWVEKIISLKSHRQKVVSRLLEHPVYADLVTRILYQGIMQYLSKQNLMGSVIPGVSAVFKFGKRMVDKAAPDLEANLEASLKGFISKNMRFFIQQSENFLNNTLSDRSLKGTIMDFWDAIEDRPMKSFQQGMDTLDLSEFVVLGYEFWLKYRKTRHFEQACRTVVDGVFERYGKVPLADILDEMGVTEAMIQTELRAAAPPVIEVLHKSGYLEDMLRRRLASFYYSEAVQAEL